MLDIKIPFPVAKQLQERARAMSGNTARALRERPGFNVERTLYLQQSNALLRVVYRAGKLVVALVLEEAARAKDEATRDTLLQLAARLAEGCHFNGSTLLGCGDGEEE